jgi:SagB-type dehydrogenase family enzyme
MMPENDDFDSFDPSYCDEYKPYIEKDVEPINDPAARLRFKLVHPGKRTFSGNARCIGLERPTVNKNDFLIERRSYRKYIGDEISLEDMGTFLEAISAHRFDGISMPKFAYASAGSLYPIQTYLYVKKDKVKGLVEGTYYYHPFKHSLLLIKEAGADQFMFPQGNSEIYENAGFIIFFVGQINAIAPSYGSWSRDFCILETGLITQLLETTCCSSDIGLCQIGGFEFEKVKDLFDLDSGHFFTHCIAGGKITEEMKEIAYLKEESAEQAKLIELVNSNTNAVIEESAHRSSYTVNFANYDTALIEKDIKSFLGRKLPDYMVPSVFVKLDSMPLCSNGKIDRNQLCTIVNREAVEVKGVDTVPQNELESTIANIWKEILEVDSININDSFFELGGNSVHLVRAYNKLKEVIGYDIPIVTLFEYSTIRSLCKYLSSKSGNGSVEPGSVDSSTMTPVEDRGELRKASRSRRRNSRDIQ